MKEYIAKRVSYKLSADDATWEKVPAAELNEGWWDGFPKNTETKARLVHTDKALILRMETKEWPIKVKATKLNEEVCLDSCMEFFFIGNTKDKKYVNIEANAASVPLCGFGEGRHGRERLNPVAEGVEFKTIVEFEKGWKLYVYIPFTFFKGKFAPVGREMLANFYKCGDETDVEHYNVWNKVDTEAPDYHRPEYFGKIVLSDEEI